MSRGLESSVTYPFRAGSGRLRQRMVHELRWQSCRGHATVGRLGADEHEGVVSDWQPYGSPPRLPNSAS